MKKIFYMLLAGAAFVSCYDEDPLSPSEEPEAIYGKYTIPQGNHDYDARIVDFYEKYQTLILYKFTSKDFGWSLQDNIAWNEATDTLKAPYSEFKFEAIPADENYVGQQLDLLESKIFSHLPDTLKRMLPQRILLCSRLDQVVAGKGHKPGPNERAAFNVYSGYYHIAVNWGNEKVLVMTVDERNRFKAEFASAFMSFVADKLGRPKEFGFVTSYNNNISRKNMLANGILVHEHRTSVTDDWLDYLKLAVSKPLTELEAEGGVLNRAVDVQGKIRQKYTLMVEYLRQQYGFDIQSVGDDID